MINKENLSLASARTDITKFIPIFNKLFNNQEVLRKFNYDPRIYSPECFDTDGLEFADENDNTVDKLKAYPEKIKIEENDKSFYKDYKAKANSNHEMYNFQTKSLSTKAYYHEIGYNNHC